MTSATAMQQRVGAHGRVPQQTGRAVPPGDQDLHGAVPAPPTAPVQEPPVPSQAATQVPGATPVETPLPSPLASPAVVPGMAIGPAMTAGKGLRKIRCVGCSRDTLPRHGDGAPLCPRCSEVLADSASPRAVAWLSVRWLRRGHPRTLLG